MQYSLFRDQSLSLKRYPVSTTSKAQSKYIQYIRDFRRRDWWAHSDPSDHGNGSKFKVCITYRKCRCCKSKILKGEIYFEFHIHGYWLKRPIMAPQPFCGLCWDFLFHAWQMNKIPATVGLEWSEFGDIWAQENMYIKSAYFAANAARKGSVLYDH